MRKILIIEDYKDILDVVSILLTQDGYTVFKMPAPEKNLAQIKELNPDLILLDIFLQENDGRTICKEIKSNHSTKDIPVILFSAISNLESIAHECNADDFIAKPFDILHLLEKIKLHIKTD